MLIIIPAGPHRLCQIHNKLPYVSICPDRAKSQKPMFLGALGTQSHGLSMGVYSPSHAVVS